MTHKHLIIGLVLGVVIACLVGAAMTFADWQLNPAGIFHGPDGTNWGFVRDTFVSWFLPTLPVALIAALVIIWFTSRRG